MLIILIQNFGVFFKLYLKQETFYDESRNLGKSRHFLQNIATA